MDIETDDSVVKSNDRSNWDTDVLIIGSGAAGLRAALAASEHVEVTLITKTTLKESNSIYAQGGIAVAMNIDDTIDLHVEDTCKAGCGLCDVTAVEIMVSEGIPRVSELVDWGANFDWEGTLPRFTQEAAHSRKRIVHKGDATGRETTDVLIQKVLDNDRIRVISNTFAIDFITSIEKKSNSQQKVCHGVYAILNGEFKPLFAKATILATGGLGRIYPCTSNPEVATGDGFAAAWRAGCNMVDMEFVQFHPTTLYLNNAPSFLISEAVRGEGGKLVNIIGEQFMDKYHQNGELAPRDVVSRAIQNEMHLTGFPCVYLDITQMTQDYIIERFPTIYETTKKYGLDISKDVIPVRPGAHFMMGGAQTNIETETNIKGLYACGEVACTGVHGANRLASNSLLECLVYGVRAGVNAAKHASSIRYSKLSEIDIDLFDATQVCSLESELDIQSVKNAIQETLWENVGIERSEEGLEITLQDLKLIESEIRHHQTTTKVPYANYIEYYETINMLATAWLITKSALIRTESRGGHYRSDYPEQNDNDWINRVLLNKNFEPDIVCL